MNYIACSILGCSERFATPGTVSPDAKFVCRRHTLPAPDEIRFQETQFDRRINKGVDPKKYVNGAIPEHVNHSDRVREHQELSRRAREAGGDSGPHPRTKKGLLKTALKALSNHPNQAAILAIVTEDLRDHQ